MTIVKALKAFFKNLTGKDVAGNTISDVIRDANKNSLGYSDRLDAIEEQVGEKEILLASSTASSTKVFVITVTDNGTITATEKV